MQSVHTDDDIKSNLGSLHYLENKSEMSTSSTNSCKKTTLNYCSDITGVKYGLKLLMHPYDQNHTVHAPVLIALLIN